MPKSLTHFLVAQKAYEILRNEQFWQPYLKHRDLVLAGSIFQDVLFFIPHEHAGKEIQELPSIFHGISGEDTLCLVKNILADNSTENSDFIYAFLAGMVAHVFADSSFHPVVIYLSGNIYSAEKEEKLNATIKHRKLEALIDRYFCPNLDKSYLNLLKNCVKKNKHLPEILNIIALHAGLKMTPSEFSMAAMSSYVRYIKIQSFLRHKSLGNLLSGFENQFSEKRRQLISLFYTTMDTDCLKKLSGNIYFRHPLTGEESTTSLDDLFNDSVSKTVAFCDLIAKNVNNKSFIDMLPHGPSLELGCPNCKVDDMKFFADSC